MIDQFQLLGIGVALERVTGIAPAEMAHLIGLLRKNDALAAAFMASICRKTGSTHTPADDSCMSAECDGDIYIWGWGYDEELPFWIPEPGNPLTALEDMQLTLSGASIDDAPVGRRAPEKGTLA